MAAIERHRVLNGLRIVLALLVTVAVAVAVARNWSQVSADLRKVDGGSLALAALCVALPPVLTMLGWRRVLADLGSPPLHLAPAGWVFRRQLGKYLPGTVWSIVAQAEMGARLHIPRRRSAVVGLITMGLAAICGLAVGPAGAPAAAAAGGRPGRWRGDSCSRCRCSRSCCGRRCSTGGSRAACGCWAGNRWSTACPAAPCSSRPATSSRRGSPPACTPSCWSAPSGRRRSTRGSCAGIGVRLRASASSLAMLTVVLPAGGRAGGLLVLLLTPATSVSVRRPPRVVAVPHRAGQTS